jgi:hypothetical protein
MNGFTPSRPIRADLVGYLLDLTEAAAPRGIADFTGTVSSFDFLLDTVEDGARASLPELSFYVFLAKEETVADQPFFAVRFESGLDPKVGESQARTFVSEIHQATIGVTTEPEVLTRRNRTTGQGSDSAPVDGLTTGATLGTRSRNSICRDRICAAVAAHQLFTLLSASLA